MHIVEGKFYSYDFVYGGSSVCEGKKEFGFEENYESLASIADWVQDKQNCLMAQRTEITHTKDVVVIKRGGAIVGVAKHFEEFSDWRFGIIRYVG
jgi:hypothetical protein